MSNDYRKDEYKKVQIPFGFDEKLQRVFLSLFHTFFVAMTGHGKTLGMKSLLLRFHKLFPDWKILIIDSLPHYEPVTIKHHDNIKIVPISDLFMFKGTIEKLSTGEEIKNLDEEVYAICGGGSHRQWERIRKVIRHPYDGKLLRINAVGGVLEVSPNHPMIRATSNRNCKASDLKVGEKLSMPYLPKRHFTQNQGLFIGTKDLAWLYGFFCAEGWVTIKNHIYFANADKTLLSKANHIFESDFHHPMTWTERNGGYTIETTSTPIAKHFRNLFYSPNSLHKHARDKIVPSLILNAPREIKLAFLDGYNDGDGQSKSPHNKKFCGFASVSRSLLASLLWLIKDTTEQSYTVHIRDDKPDFIQVVINERCRNSKKERNVIKKIKEKLYRGYLYDLEVEGDHTFCAGIGQIRVHNSKDKRDYADLNADVPICFVETTEPLDLKNLLEPVVGAKMMYYFDKIIEEAIFDTLGEIQRNIDQKVTKADEGKLKIHGKDLGKLRVLNYTLKKLVNLVEQPNIISELQLHDGFNIMPVSLPHVKNPNLKRAFQQLIVRSTLILLLSDLKYEKTLLVLDENHKWNPQRYSSICKQPLSDFISEGRSQDKIVWQSDQALTKVDKESLKNVKVWVVGQQMESNEVDDAVHTVNDITDLAVTEQDIKSLKIGHFILVDGLHGTVSRVYLQPYGVPDSVAERIVREANPDLAEPFIIEYEKSQVLGDDDLVYRQKYEELDIENKKLKAEIKNFPNRRTEIFNEAKAQLEKDLKTNYVTLEQHQQIVNGQTTVISSLQTKAKLGEGLSNFVSEVVR